MAKEQAATEIAPVQNTAIAIPSRSERAANLAKRVQAASNVIKIAKNGVGFSIPGLGDTDGPMDIVILDFVAKNVYYDPSVPYDPDKVTPPICGAIGFDVNDNLIPMDESPDKQSESCKECPMNEFGSRGKGKACQNRRMAAILPPDADSTTDIMMLDISATGVKGFDTVIAQMATVAGKEPHNFKVKIFPKQAGNTASKTIGFSVEGPIEDDRIAFFEGKIDQASVMLAQPIRFEL
jgi:hypothetical protein